MKPLPLPAGIHNVNPYLVVDDPDIVVRFLTEALEARETSRHTFEGRTTIAMRHMRARSRPAHSP